MRLTELVADQERDHREDDGACESREIAELASAEREVGIIGVVGAKPRRRTLVAESRTASVCSRKLPFLNMDEAALDQRVDAISPYPRHRPACESAGRAQALLLKTT